jgi:hypothetical protein
MSTTSIRVMTSHLEIFLSAHDPRNRPDDEVLELASKRPMSLRIDASRFLCLDRIAAHIGTTRTGVAQALLEAAAWDAAKYYGIELSEDELIDCYNQVPLGLADREGE